MLEASVRAKAAPVFLTLFDRFVTGAEHIFVRSSDAVEYAVEQQLAGNKGEKGPASAI